MKMAKEQSLFLNPTKFSGACGKLMCCLKYEHPLYQQFDTEAPAVGEHVGTPAGEGVVVGRSVPADSVTVRLGDGRRTTCPKADVCGSRKAFEDQHGTHTDRGP